MTVFLFRPRPDGERSAAQLQTDPDVSTYALAESVHGTIDVFTVALMIVL